MTEATAPEAPAYTARGYTWSDHDEDPEQGGEVDWHEQAPRSRRLQIADDMVAHMADNQCPSHRITGNVWEGRNGKVRVYTSVGSYVDLTATADGLTKCSDLVGHDRGSRAAIDAAWDSI